VMKTGGVSITVFLAFKSVKYSFKLLDIMD